MRKRKISAIMKDIVKDIAKKKGLIFVDWNKKMKGGKRAKYGKDNKRYQRSNKKSYSKKA